MLDRPDRPEPSMPRCDNTEEASNEQSPSKMPPQTAVLDRPDRPEPERQAAGPASSAEQPFAASMQAVRAQSPAQLHEADITQQACLT